MKPNDFLARWSKYRRTGPSRVMFVMVHLTSVPSYRILHLQPRKEVLAELNTILPLVLHSCVSWKYFFLCKWERSLKYPVTFLYAKVWLLSHLSEILPYAGSNLRYFFLTKVIMILISILKIIIFLGIWKTLYFKFTKKTLRSQVLFIFFIFKSNEHHI